MSDLLYEARKLKNESYDDREVKNEIIKVSEKLLGFQVKRNDINDIEAEYGIDLISVNDPTLGVEVERGGPVYGHWDDDWFNNIFKFPFKTLNMPDRKEHFWVEKYRRHDKYGNYIDKEEVDNSVGCLKNIFVRTDWFFNQYNVVFASVIRDPEQTFRKRGKVSNNTIPEGWLLFPRISVVVFNKINGEIVLETDDPATHLPPMSIEKRKELYFLKKKIQNEEKKKKAREAYLKNK